MPCEFSRYFLGTTCLTGQGTYRYWYCSGYKQLRETEHSITIIINPACSLCVKVYDIVISLEGYRVNLVFVVNSGDQRSYQAALKMISSGIKDKWEETNRLISDWFEKRRCRKI